MNLLSKMTLFAAVAALLAPAAFAALDRADKYFLEEAAKVGMKEREISEQALVNLNTPDVRNFAQQMLNEHARRNAELQALAAQKGVVLPSPDAKAARKGAENRRDIDDEYLAEIGMVHRETIELFEKAAKAEDPDIAAFALKALPHLREHLESGKQLKRTNQQAAP